MKTVKILGVLFAFVGNATQINICNEKGDLISYDTDDLLKKYEAEDKETKALFESWSQDEKLGVFEKVTAEKAQEILLIDELATANKSFKEANDALKTEIEALKAENEALKAEIEALKAGKVEVKADTKPAAK